MEYSKQLQWLARNGLGFRDVLINASATNIGLWPNKKRAVDGALTLSDFAVILEDDIVLERDALRWFEWHVTSGFIFQRPEVAVATCWSASSPYDHDVVESHDYMAFRDLGLLDKFVVQPWATPWGWATWKRTWDVVGTNWTGQDLVLAQLVAAQGWFETIPLVARCNNIGSVGFHKRSATSSHIQQRAVTSASFQTLDRCAYAELPRKNKTGLLFNEEVYHHLR